MQTCTRTRQWRSGRHRGLGYLFSRSFTRTERNGTYEALIDAYHHTDVLRLGIGRSRGLAPIPHTRERTQKLPALRFARYARVLRACGLISPGLADARFAELHPLRERRRARLLRPRRWSGSNEYQRGRDNVTTASRAHPA